MLLSILIHVTFRMVESLQVMFSSVDIALNWYVTELKALGLWDSTTLVQTSDFGRTISPNGNMGTGKLLFLKAK